MLLELQTEEKLERLLKTGVGVKLKVV